MNHPLFVFQALLESFIVKDLVKSINQHVSSASNIPFSNENYECLVREMHRG